MIDMIFDLKGFLGLKNSYRLKIFRTPEKDVVIATELRDDPEKSTSNTADKLATQVIDKFEINPERLLWIEHYPTLILDSSVKKERFDTVKLQWNGKKFSNPEWKNIQKEDVETMIFMKLPEESFETIRVIK